MSMPSTAILTDITQQYSHATSGWYAYLFPLASHLFAMLGIIELAWSALWWTLEKNDVTSLWTELLKKIISISFFYFILLNAQTWIPAIIKGFMVAGAGASNVSTLDPGSILDQGISIATSVFVPLTHNGILNALNIGGWLVAIFVAIIILICFASIAALLVVTLVESYIVVGAGVLMLGFSSSRWTSQFATNYLMYAINVGVKLFVLYLIVGVGANVANTWGNLILTGGLTNLTPFFEVLGGAMVYAFLAQSIPDKASSIISGGSNSSLSGALENMSQTTAAVTTPIAAGYSASKKINDAIAKGQSNSTSSPESSHTSKVAKATQPSPGDNF